MKWKPELRVKRGQRVWSGANEYEAAVSHRTGFLPPDLNIEDKGNEFWFPVCWICDLTVTGDRPGHDQEDGYWVHDGDCEIESLCIGLENMENRERYSA